MPNLWPSEGPPPPAASPEGGGTLPATLPPHPLRSARLPPFVVTQSCPSAGLGPWQNSLMLKIDYSTERLRERWFYEPKGAAVWGQRLMGKIFQVSKEHERPLG